MPNSPNTVGGLASLGDALAAVTQDLQGRASQQGSTLYFDYQGLTMFPDKDVRNLTQCVNDIVWGGLGQAGYGHGSLFLSVHCWSLSIDQARVTVQFAYTATSGPTDLSRLSGMLKTSSEASSNQEDATVSLCSPRILSYFDKGTDADCHVHLSSGEGAVVELSLTLPHDGPEIEPAYLNELATVSAWLIGELSEEEALLATRLQRDGWYVRQFANLDDALAFWAGSKNRLEPALVMVTEQKEMSPHMLSEARRAWSPQCRVIYGVHDESSGVGPQAAPGIEIRKVPFSPADLREIKELAATLEATRNRASQRERRDDSRTRPTALVVDDNLINRILAAEMLHVLGFESDMAENGREAVEYVERYRPDVVLMDVDMPVMDGMEATERIRRYEAHDGGMCTPVPIIATTARDEPDISKACEAIGMTAFVPKPLMMAQLAAALPHPDVPAMASTRLETDGFGPIEVDSAALWGAQTERSRRHFSIGHELMPLEIIHALAEIKQAAAQVHGELGLLEAAKADAVAAAAARVAAGEFDAQFPLVVWQTGSGTQTNMNVNEVIASIASLSLGGGLGAARCVHPNDDVNLGQSSNDVFPTAMHVAAVRQSRILLAALTRLRSALQAKEQAFADLIKIGRTHLQDATPMTFGQEFGGYDAQLAIAEAAVRSALPAVHALAIGGTAVGTGLNTHPEFGERVAARLAQRLGEPFTVASNLFAALAGHEPLVGLHSALKMLAIALNKIANDIRLMASGPRAGLGELHLPANEPGSSIMPGKVNPTQIEALTMVCAQVMGHDVAIGIAASQGQLELNVYKPLIAHNVLHSLRLLSDVMASLTEHCIGGIEVNAEHAQWLLAQSLMLVTALTPHIGYDRAATIAKHALKAGLPLRNAALEVGGITGAEYDAWVDPRRMLKPGIIP